MIFTKLSASLCHLMSLIFLGILPIGGIWKGKCWTALKVLDTLQNWYLHPFNHCTFFLLWNCDFSSSTWEATSGKEIPYCSCLQTQKHVFSMERHFSKRRNNCALASFSLELISCLKNTATEKCWWLLLRLFKKCALLKYILIVKCTYTAAFKKWIQHLKATRVILYLQKKVTLTGHLCPFDQLTLLGSIARISLFSCARPWWEKWWW